MDENKVLSFIKQLSNDTANEKLCWQRMNDYQNITKDSPEEIFFMLFQCEYRHIDYHNSFYAVIGRGAIFALKEDNESGRDGVRSIGYKLYLQDEEKRKVYNLPCPASAIYQLLNAIQSCIARSEADAENFIDNYLSQQNSPDNHQ